MAKRLSVVVSQGQSPNPVKRKLEEDIITTLMLEPGIDVTVVPHLYDIRPESTGHLALNGLPGNVVVVSWLYERASRWTLNRMGVMGKPGTVLLELPDGDEDAEEDEAVEEDLSRVAANRQVPNRFIYCLDFRASNKPHEFVEEIKRIKSDNQVDVLSNGSGLGGLPILSGNGSTNRASAPEGQPESENGSPHDVTATINRIEDQAGRRWYPVIDFSRCTNCMECIDFCLFGVYGVDPMETILVEQPDNCRKGCPACSRVCPENAIMFPQHKTPAIAGANEAAEAMKIDLSQLFGAPSSENSLEVAAAERDEQLRLAGRDEVGMSVGIPKRQSENNDQPRDRLDDLVDQLDQLDL
ncbi:MAG: ferredoxin family protein [Pirellulaceae bacterium]